jgi:hypothetical protein
MGTSRRQGIDSRHASARYTRHQRAAGGADEIAVAQVDLDSLGDQAGIAGVKPVAARRELSSVLEHDRRLEGDRHREIR